MTTTEIRWTRPMGHPYATNGYDILDSRYVTAAITREGKQFVLRVWTRCLVTPAATVYCEKQRDAREIANRLLAWTITLPDAARSYEVQWMARALSIKVVDEETAAMQAALTAEIAALRSAREEA